MVTVYSMVNCGPCKRLKYLLEQAGISYVLIDVDIDPPAFTPIVKKTGILTVPQTVVGDQIIIGPDINKIKEALQWKKIN